MVNQNKTPFIDNGGELLTDKECLERLEEIRAEIKTLYMRKNRLESQLVKYMQSHNLVTLKVESYIVKLEETWVRDWDHARFLQLLNEMDIDNFLDLIEWTPDWIRCRKLRDSENGDIIKNVVFEIAGSPIPKITKESEGK